MATAIPAIACLGVIGRNLYLPTRTLQQQLTQNQQNSPLHITILPTTRDPQTGAPTPLRTPLQFSLLLSSTLDVFESRARHASTSNTLLSGDFGLLHAVDERLAAYGWETNTGVRFVVVVDMRGRVLDRKAGAAGAATNAGVGLRDGELKVVFRAVQTAYVRLLQNPFYDPDEVAGGGNGVGGKRITSRRFGEEMRRIGEVWVPGSVNAL
ncbi:Sedlin, N-terminal conserved region-domain-containing protein [Xylariales sp. AK1849]|nr:Sedlin, N-terminal conserved region-domain-containing protein [Xylariales sp. AK1849]